MIRIIVCLCFCVSKVFGQGGIQFQPGMIGTQTGFQGPGFSPIGTQTFQPQPGMPQNPTQTGTTSTGFGSPFTGPMVTGGMPFGPGSVFGPMGPLRPLSRKYCHSFSSFCKKTILFCYTNRKDLQLFHGKCELSKIQNQHRNPSFPDNSVRRG